MLKSRGVLFMANLVLALCLTGSAAQQQEVGGEPGIPAAKLVNALRFLNTVEVRYRGENNRFAKQAELLTFVRGKNLYPALERFVGQSPLDLENPAPYHIQITTDPDAAHFQISIGPDFSDKSAACLPAVFSDDRGVIFLGQAMGCRAAPQSSAVPK